MNTIDCSLKPLVPFYQEKRPVDWLKQFGRKAPLEVEIGFGLGEVLIRFAKENPDRDFIGIEQHWERIYKCLRGIEREKSVADPARTGRYLDNIKILRIDARLAFERLIGPETVDRIYCLFPCPWPKKRHVKNRLFSNEFLRLSNSRLKKNGEIKVVTDFDPYFNWIQGELPGTGFAIKKNVIQPQFDTKFERKWFAEGKREFFELSLLKKKHVRVPVKEDTALKEYRLKEFDPQRFQFQDVKGEISVILKDRLYDPRKEILLIHLIVAEPDLTQHLWVSIMKEKDHWSVARGDGQEFFPTPGIAEALRSVHDAAHSSSRK